MKTEAEKTADAYNSLEETFVEELTPLQKLEKIPSNTLDQGICESISIELREMGYKFRCVLIPCVSPKEADRLKNWDFWGPFFMSLVFGLFVNSNFTLILRYR